MGTDFNDTTYSPHIIIDINVYVYVLITSRLCIIIDYILSNIIIDINVLITSRLCIIID